MKGKYTIFNITNSNQYLKIKTILNNNNGVLLTQQKKIKIKLKDFKLKDYNPIIFLINNYISPPPPEYQAKNIN